MLFGALSASVNIRLRSLLSRMYSFEGENLIEAIIATFRHRGTSIEAEPGGLTDDFYADPARAIQWRAFVRRSRFTQELGDLEKLVAEVRRFAIPGLDGRHRRKTVHGSLASGRAVGMNTKGQLYRLSMCPRSPSATQ